MAAFERILSGIPEMDTALDNIRLGDNVVWQVTDLEEFRLFIGPYVSQAIKDNRNIIYVPFASHEPFFEEQEGLKVVPIELSHRFETFTVDIHSLIEQEGTDAFYVFDCLSELQTAWATDLMMGNFFRLTCPFLFQLDTVAFFPLVRGKHSFKAIAKIRDTTQLFLDVYSDSSQVYVRPLKVWNRYSETMFLPHSYNPETGSFQPLMAGVLVSRFYQLMNKSERSGNNQNIDSWDRFFNFTEQMYLQGLDVSDACNRMCNVMMTRDERMRKMIKANFTPEDYFQVRSRMVGTGMIGGKACGMLLARKIIENKCPDLYARLEPHDSYYIGSDVFSSTMSRSALDYRLRRGLANRDEQMALLVQRVSGSRYDNFFMPCAAGVGYSYSPYRFSEAIDPTAGMLRLVMGLGTGAVDRTQGSYPRLVSLDKPQLTAAVTSAEKHQFSQRKVDLIDFTSDKVESRDLFKLQDQLPLYLKRLLLEHDYDAERMFQDRGQYREIYFISCGGLVKNAGLMNDMHQLMALIQEEYQYPVDIEYTINVSDTGEYVINLLQCRPLQVAKAIGALNWHFRDSGKHLMLLVPGRIGTSSPELGVPTVFSDISGFDIICEVSESNAGYMPELSYGSHIFQDLVEAGILYGAVFENEKTIAFEPKKIRQLGNQLTDFYPEGEQLYDIIGIYCVSDRESLVYHDMKDEHLLCIL